MGRRVEYILIIAIVIIALLPFVMDIKKSHFNIAKIGNKNSELNNFTEYEINASRLQHTLKAKKAEEIKNSWHLQDVNISTNKFKSLTAKKSIVKSEKIELLNNVIAIKKDGTIYKSQKAIYDTKSKNLITPNNFTISRHKDIVQGKKLEYFPNEKITKAKDVNGTFVLKKAKK